MDDARLCSCNLSIVRLLCEARGCGEACKWLVNNQDHQDDCVSGENDNSSVAKAAKHVTWSTLHCGYDSLHCHSLGERDCSSCGRMEMKWRLRFNVIGLSLGKDGLCKLIRVAHCYHQPTPYLTWYLKLGTNKVLLSLNAPLDVQARNKPLGMDTIGTATYGSQNVLCWGC